MAEIPFKVLRKSTFLSRPDGKLSSVSCLHDDILSETSPYLASHCDTLHGLSLLNAVTVNPIYLERKIVS